MLETSKRAAPLFVMVTSSGDAVLPSVIVPKSNTVSGDICSFGVAPFSLTLFVEPESEHPESAIDKNANKKMR